MVYFAQIDQVSSAYTMLQHIGRVATLKLVPRSCLRYLQATLIIGEGGGGGGRIGLIISVRCCIQSHDPLITRLFEITRLLKAITPLPE